MTRNSIMLLTVALFLGYAAFVQWMWGWPAILAEWREVGLPQVLAALALLGGTYFVRTCRMRDYFPNETAGQFIRLFRLTQVHNILNIMLPFRTGESSFPLLMRSEFGVPLAHGTSALLVLRLLDLHALLAAAGLGLVAASGYGVAALSAWVVFLVLPLCAFPLRAPLLAAARRNRSPRLSRLISEIDEGIPRNLPRFARAWLFTVVNWGVKVVVLAWVLNLLGVISLAACIGGALGGELSAVLPVHAPAGVGTYPAGIVAGATALGANQEREALAVLVRASINAHLLTVVSSLVGAGVSLLLSAVVERRGARSGARHG
jgi:uncharacterized membrane protein YbhN (UPF0104 family)